MPGEHDVREIATKCDVHIATVRRKRLDFGVSPNCASRLFFNFPCRGIPRMVICVVAVATRRVSV